MVGLVSFGSDRVLLTSLGRWLISMTPRGLPGATRAQEVGGGISMGEGRCKDLLQDLGRSCGKGRAGLSVPRQDLRAWGGEASAIPPPPPAPEK